MARVYQAADSSAVASTSASEGTTPAARSRCTVAAASSRIAAADFLPFQQLRRP